MTDETDASPTLGAPSASDADHRSRWGAVLAGSPFDQLIELDELGVVVAAAGGGRFQPELGVALVEAFDGPGGGLLQEARGGVLMGNAQRFAAMLAGTEHDIVMLPVAGGGALLQLREANDDARQLQRELALRTLELESLRSQLRRYALEDPLTGVDSVQQLLTRLNGEISRSRRYAAPLAVLLVEIADLGDLNLRFGHLVGDVVLSQCAYRLRDLLRDHDLVGRYTTNQFCLGLPHTDRAGAEVLAGRVRATVGGTPFIAGPDAVRVALRTGLATVQPSDETIETVLARAEAALA